MAAVHDRGLFVGVLRVAGLERLPHLAAAVVGDVGHVHAVAHVDPGALLAHRGTAVTRGLGLDDQAFRHQFGVGVEEGLVLGAAVHRALPVVHLAAAPAHEVGRADIAQHGLASDDLVVAPGQHRIAGGPGVGQEQRHAGHQRLEALIGGELAHPLERRQVAGQVWELALVVAPGVEVGGARRILRRGEEHRLQAQQILLVVPDGAVGTGGDVHLDPDEVVLVAGAAVRRDIPVADRVH